MDMARLLYTINNVCVCVSMCVCCVCARARLHACMHACALKGWKLKKIVIPCFFTSYEYHHYLQRLH